MVDLPYQLVQDAQICWRCMGKRIFRKILQIIWPNEIIEITTLDFPEVMGSHLEGFLLVFFLVAKIWPENHDLTKHLSFKRSTPPQTPARCLKHQKKIPLGFLGENPTPKKISWFLAFTFTQMKAVKTGWAAGPQPSYTPRKWMNVPEKKRGYLNNREIHLNQPVIFKLRGHVAGTFLWPNCFSF